MTANEKLKAAALAATPGPWRAGSKVPHYVYSAGGEPICQCDSMDELPRLEECRNASFIALANPTAILDLLAQLDAAKKDSERLDWLDKQSISYGFEDTHEGNSWSLDGPFMTARDAIDAYRKGEKHDA